MPLIAPAHRTRFFLSLLILVALAGLFWTGSRYPSLNEKAMMSGALQLEDALSFEARFETTAGMGLAERLFFSTLNWIDTNKKGMTFGILFAAAFLTAAANLTSRSFRGGFSNALLGLGLGAPLGVCVNCAAPIAKGMYAAGLRAETTMAAMIASPTLNVVVLTMAFSLLPAYMALTKIALSLGLILIVVPLVARLLPQKELPPEAQLSAAPVPQAWSAAELGSIPAETEAFLPALAAVAGDYVKNLWYIIKLTVPLMLLAGFLGTLVAVLLPGELILGLEFSALVLALVVLVGVFLPVPIGFDVVMAGGLLATGLSQGYVMALLFTLGSFSVYSYFIMATSLGQRAALSLTFAVALAGFGAGLGTDAYHRWQSEKALELLLQGDAGDHAPAPWGAAMAGAPTVTVTAMPLNPPQGHSEGQSIFTRQEAREIGIDKPVEFTMRDMWPPFWEGRSLASGDIDNDGALDLVVASTEVGLYLYANDGSGQFNRISVDLGPLAERKIFNAVLVDLNNDGWRDLFLTSYLEGNFLWLNQGGQFTGTPQPVQNRADTPLTLALSFADVDRDGDLDVALGNWAAGWYRRIPGEESRNRLLWNPGAGRPFTGAEYADLPGLPGETLSILFSDLDRDGAADLLVGNDFDIPDYFYRGDGA
ncbi:MAG: FG-GAP-like repeat-containing protein, partial [Pseudomonadota bacterium]|nr:FG-GAP-like repeat-containing protein [Pseudomonadota bacterium]